MAKEQAYHFKPRIEGRLILCLRKGQELSRGHQDQHCIKEIFFLLDFLTKQVDLVFSAVCLSSNFAARGCKETRVQYQEEKNPNTIMYSPGIVYNISQAENSASPGRSPGSSNSSMFGTSQHHGYHNSVCSQIPHSQFPLTDSPIG